MRVRFAAVQVMLLPFVLLGAACGHDSTARPTPLAPSSAPPTVALTGRVLDYSGTPVTDAAVSAFPLIGGSADWAKAPSRTDRSGHYRLDLPQHGGVVQVVAYKAGYLQPCAVTVRLAMGASVDISIRTDAVVTGLPMANDLRHVTGVVYEATETGRRPLSGADVGWEHTLFGSPAAYTRTDDEGRYRLCGLPSDVNGEGLVLYAWFNGTYKHAFAPPGAADAVIDIDLPQGAAVGSISAGEMGRRVRGNPLDAGRSSVPRKN